MIDNSSDCLLVIDVQNDFCAGGALEVPAGDEVVGVINQLGTQFEHKILTQDWHPAGHESFASSHAVPPQRSELRIGTRDICRRS